MSSGNGQTGVVEKVTSELKQTPQRPRGERCSGRKRECNDGEQRSKTKHESKVQRKYKTQKR